MSDYELFLEDDGDHTTLYAMFVDKSTWASLNVPLDVAEAHGWPRYARVSVTFVDDKEMDDSVNTE